MTKTLSALFLSILLVLPGAAVLAQEEATAEPTVEVTVVPPEEEVPEDLPGDEDDNLLTDEDLTAVFGFPPEFALPLFAAITIIIQAFKLLFPNVVGSNKRITPQQVTVFVAGVAWVLWWVVGRFSVQSQFLAGLTLFVDFGPTIVSAIAFLVGPVAMFWTFRKLHVPILGTSSWDADNPAYLRE